MMRTTTTLCFLMLSVTLACADFNPFHFVAQSVRSHIFEPVRPTTPPVVIKECGKLVTEPYGLLEQTFKRGETAVGYTCTWKLRAPKNHHINLISTAFDLLESTSKKYTEYDDSKTTAINFYDSDEAGKNLMSPFHLTPKERAGGWVQSISSGENMVVELEYRDNPDFAKQTIKVTYEFLDHDKMMELLKAQN